MIKQFDELEWIMHFFDNSVDLNYEGIDRVRNFSLLWNLFETFACNKNANIISITTAVNTINLREGITFELVSDHLNYFSSRYFNPDGTEKESFNGLKFRNGQTEQNAKEVVREVLTRNETVPSEILKALFYILFRFRNNLFHGEKEVVRLNAQVDNFIVANDLLSKILEIMKRQHLLTDQQ